MTVGLASGATFPIGTTVVTYTATDGSGNVSSASFNVEVVGIAPVIVSPGDITQDNDLGQCGAAVSYTAIETVVGIPASTITYTIAPGSIFNQGTTEVTATATNAVGTSSATFNVTVNDAEFPTVVAQPLTVALDVNGNASITVTQIDNASFDNCSLVLSLDKMTFDCSNVGTNTVILKGVDPSGNTSTATAVVTVVDAINPTVITQDITVNLDASGIATITTTQIDNASFDNCGVASITLDRTSFDCESVGANTVTLTVADVNGNTSTATAVVTVVDNIAPTVITQNISATINKGGVTVTTAQINNGSFDNCGIESMEVSPNTFVCGDQGDHTVTLTVTDIHGNTNSADVIVTVLGDVPTIAIADFTAVPTQDNNTVYLGYGPQSMTLNTTTTGGAGFTYSWTSLTGEIVASEANPTVTPLISTTYTVTVTNANGCEDTTSIEVCVKDVRYIDKHGKYKGKVLVCHHEGHGEDDHHDGDDGEHNNGSSSYHTIKVDQHSVEKHLRNHGDTLGGCDVTCSTVYVEVVVSNDDDDDDHGDGDHADNDDKDDAHKSDSNETKVMIYPNPVVDEATVTLNLNKKEEGYVYIYDYKGKKIFSKKVKNLKKGVKVNMRGKKTGNYYVRIKHKGKTYTATMFKKR